MANRTSGPNGGPPSPGQRIARWQIAAGFACLGGLIAAYLFTLDQTSEDLDRLGRGNVAYIVAAAAVGAYLAGLLFAGLFGRPGPRGWGLAALGLIAATLVGSAIGGTFVVPIAGTLTAPFLLYGIAREAPWLLVLWAAGGAALHLWARRPR